MTEPTPQARAAPMEHVFERLARLDTVFDRLARLEESVANIKENMATRADIQEIKTLIAEKEAVQVRWLLGIMSAACVTLVVAMIRTFM